VNKIIRPTKHNEWKESKIKSSISFYSYFCFNKNTDALLLQLFNDICTDLVLLYTYTKMYPV